MTIELSYCGREIQIDHPPSVPGYAFNKFRRVKPGEKYWNLAYKGILSWDRQLGSGSTVPYWIAEKIHQPPIKCCRYCCKHMQNERRCL